MDETEAVSMELPRAVGNEPKCGPETGFSPTKPECNGNHHHGNDIDNSYVFVSGADAADTKVSTVESGKISDPHIVEVNGNVEGINGDTLEGLTGKTESLAKVKVEQVEEESEALVDSEQEDSGLASGLEVNQGSKIGGSGLVTGSGESGGSINISSDIDSSGHANGEYGVQVEALEACQGSQDVVVGVVDCELQDVSVGSAEDGVKFVGENGVVDAVDVSVKAEGEVNLSAEVVENGQYEVFQPPSLDLESKSINTKEESNVVGDVVQGESADVSVKAEEEVKLLEDVIKTRELEASPSTSLNVDLESDPINSKTETDVESRDVRVNAADEVELLEEVIKTGEIDAPPSTSSDVDLESEPINSKEDTSMVEGVAESELQDVSLNVNDEVKLPAEDEVPKSISLDLDMELDPIHTKKETHVPDDVVDCELQDVSVKAEDETKLSGEVAEVAELKMPSSTSFGVVFESGPINNKEEIYVIEDVVECGSQNVSVNLDDELKSSVEVLETTEHEVPPSVSLDLELESNPTNTKEETGVVEDVVELELKDVSEEASGEVKLPREVVETSEHEIPPSTSSDVDLESKSINSKEEKDLVEDVVETELDYACMKVHTEDRVKLSREVVETAGQEIPPSTSLGVDSESKSKNSQEEKDVVEDELQDVCVKVHAEDKVKLSEKVVETAQLEISSSTFLDLDLESNPINRKDWIDLVEDVVAHDMQNASVKAGDDVKLSGEVVETAEYEITPSAPLDLDLLMKNPINNNEEINVVEDVAECGLKDGSLKVEDEKSSGEAVETAEHEVPTSTSLDLEMGPHPINTKEETDIALEVVQCESQDLSLKAKDEVKLLEEVTETAEHEVSLSKSLDLDLESKSIRTEEKINMAANVERQSQDVNLKAKDEVKVSGEVVEIAEHEVPSSTSLDLNLESNPTSTKVEIGVVANAVEYDLQDANVQTEDDVKLSAEVVEIAEHGVPSSAFDSSDVNKEGAANIELDTEDVEDIVDQIDGAPGSSNENLPLGEIMDTGNSQDNITPVAPPSCSSENMTDREEASIKTKRKPFNFLIRVPRFDDEGLREQIRLAKLNIDEKTKLRDAIQVQILEKRASTQIHGIDYEYAKGESRNARKSVRSKRMEIDSLQSVINKAKNALSVDDIDSQIYNMERMIQHETLQLKEEKQLIREIKQLKQLREQLSSNMGSQDEIKQAVEQRGEAEERLKILRKELDVLKGKVLKAESAAVEAEKKYDDENKKVRELQSQFRASNEVRQAAYVQWQSLRTELSKKSEYFFKYKDDAAVASNYVYSRDTHALYRVCMNNVERFMELWNTNGEFRRDYAKCNARSTLWRLGTLDGRALGPDESPPVLPSYADSRASRIVPTPVKVDLASQFPTLELKQDRATESVASGSKSMKKVTEEKNKIVTNNGPAISTQVKGLDTVSGEDIIDEEPKKSREEIEAIKKAEEMERKEAESKLKEQRRLEALAKASEARERKKKQAEKLQMRAELKTLKEAEQKEKEREKRLRKKERKKAAATDVSDTNTCEIGPGSESAVETTSKEAEVKDVSSSVGSKKPKKHWLFGKQGKTKSSIPPPLRNRNKKKLQQWMWVGFTSLAILFVFWMGNMGIFSSGSYKRRSPVMT